MDKLQTDVLIVGGGLIGAALMFALKDSGMKTTLVEARSYENELLREGFDARTLALSPASVNVLKRLGLWSSLAIKAQAIEHIHVSEQGRFATACLDGSLDNPLGYVIELHTLQHALYHALKEQDVLAPAELLACHKDDCTAIVTHKGQTKTIRAQLIVAADGGQSTVRQCAGLTANVTHYGFDALVANIGLQRAHRHWAYERFTAHGPLAMLPMGENRAALVWSLPRKDAEALKNAPDARFLSHLQQTFGYKLGRFERVGQRSLFPLKKMVMDKPIDWPFVFVGNAAHMLHPVAGQGFNLGLRDVAALAQCLKQEGLNAGALSHYQAMRQHDQKAIIGLTDGLLRVFGSTLPGMRLARGLGMLAMSQSETLRSLLSRYARGFGGVVPELVCDI